MNHSSWYSLRTRRIRRKINTDFLCIRIWNLIWFSNDDFPVSIHLITPKQDNYHEIFAFFFGTCEIVSTDWLCFSIVLFLFTKTNKKKKTKKNTPICRIFLFRSLSLLKKYAYTRRRKDFGVVVVVVMSSG